MRFTYDLKRAPDDISIVGGKAASLGRLMRWGMPVPAGFVITTAALDTFAKHNALRPDGERIWPESLRAEIARAYKALARKTHRAPLVARSSATAEDGADASFAGQHLTVLNITTLDGLLDGIARCWASLHSKEAVEYRRTRARDDHAASMAVVVQALVPATASGVAFTMDPVSGDNSVVVIEAVRGLGEGLVAGIVTPDRLSVSRTNYQVLSHDISTKERQIVPDRAGGTRVETLASPLAGQPALTDALAAKLARLAAKIEERSGWPQDIEWAVVTDRVYVLQARPVTQAGPAEGWLSEFDTPTRPDTIWTSANVQEVLPGMISPLNASLTLEILDRYGMEPVERLGVRLKSADPFSAYFYGRPFLNVSMSLEVIDQTPFASDEGFFEQFYGQGREQDIGVQIPRVVKRFSFARLYRYANVLPRMLWFTLRMPAEIRRSERVVAELERADRDEPLDAQTDEALITIMERDMARSAEVGMTHVSGAGITGSNFELLRAVTKNWLADADGSLHNRLCTGLAVLESAQPAFELWDLSRVAVTSTALRAAFESPDGEEIGNRLDALSGPEIEKFRSSVAAFLGRHGHRSVMEAEISARTWAEDMPTVYSMIRNYLHAGDGADPRHAQERQRHEREQTTAHARAQLSWWRKIVFTSFLGNAQKWVANREHTKDLFVRAVNRGRKISRHVGTRLAARGLLDDPFDVYYLTWEEAKALVRQQVSRAAASEIVERRKAQERRNRQVRLPETFRGRPRPVSQAAPLPDGDTLRGIPVSPGRVTGLARVITDPRLDGMIEPGEILVAPVTDAGWTPLFIAAAGVVVDIGGSLSHGSTVAREYGLPAVVNVKHGTRMIRTGQTVTVDGTAGIVIVSDS
jgi:pyruvate,water dikinase